MRVLNRSEERLPSRTEYPTDSDFLQLPERPRSAQEPDLATPMPRKMRELSLRGDSGPSRDLVGTQIGAVNLPRLASGLRFRMLVFGRGG